MSKDSPVNYKHQFAYLTAVLPNCCLGFAIVFGYAWFRVSTIGLVVKSCNQLWLWPLQKFSCQDVRLVMHFIPIYTLNTHFNLHRILLPQWKIIEASKSAKHPNTTNSVTCFPMHVLPPDSFRSNILLCLMQCHA